MRRRNCPVCGEIYNVYTKPPKVEGRCDLHPEVLLEHRADDNEASVQTRLDTYRESTAPLLDYYERTGRLKKIDGTGDPEEIYAELERLI